jgi:GAF domain-containing protein
MKRRITIRGKATKGPGRNAATVVSAPSTPRRRRSVDVGLQKQLDEARRELRESHEQQTATSEVLKVISRSPGDLEPVFKAMLENAARICEAKFGTLFRFEGGQFQRVASIGTPAALVKFQKKLGPFQPGDTSHLLGPTRFKRGVTSIADLRKVSPDNPAAKYGRARSAVAVPMIQDDKLAGAFVIYRQEVRPFTDKQIELVQNFAAQAVVAIENTRLLNELRQRTDDLTESLEQQTATSEVLKVISTSPGELAPVFDAMLAHALQVCSAQFGVLFRHNHGRFVPVASRDVPPAYAEFLKRAEFKPLTESGFAGTPLHRLLLSKDIVRTDDETMQANPGPAARYGGARSLIAVPLSSENDLIGAFIIYRTEVRPFTDKQIDLVKNFAAQAVIAIENTRLLNELRQRTDDLTEALEQQTATSEVLKVISSSPGELSPVFDAMLDKATRICEAAFGILYRYDGQAFSLEARIGAVPELVELLQRGPIDPHPDTILGRILATKKLVEFADARTQRAYLERNPVFVTAVEIGGARSHLGVPMLKENMLVGAFVIFRQEVRPFTDKQIELLQNFAAQAVIAIENARLLNELRQRTDDLTEALEQQTATSEVLGVISSSPGDLEPVFRALLENATRICDAKFGNLWLAKDGGFVVAATHGVPAEYRDEIQLNAVLHPGPHVPVARAASSRQLVHVHDLRLDRAYLDRDPVSVRGVEKGGVRTLVAVPMLKDKEVIGAFAIYRQEVRPFTKRQIELVQNFAAQAVIAIENTRLLNELRESLQQQTATTEVLKVISSSPGELKPVFEAMLQNATRMCGANYGILHLYEREQFHPVATLGAPPALLELHQQRPSIDPRPGTNLHQLVQSKNVVHILDDAESPNPGAPARAADARTTLTVPMLKDNNLIGAFSIYRQEVQPFTEKQIDLVQNFAAQAVIAIENTRLLNELRQRTDDLTESLEQQTATSEVLRVISSSPGELEPVFQSMLENATRVCGAEFSTLTLAEGDGFRNVARYNLPPEFAQSLPTKGFRPHPRSGLGEIARTKRVTHIEDAHRTPAYLEGDPVAVSFAKLSGARTLIIVPMLKEEHLVGTIGIFRKEVRSFSDRQVELLQNFAAQAVIAIENARLLSELRQRTDDLTESLEQQTATSEVLKVISGSPGDLEPVFQSMLDNATRICNAKFGILWLSEGNGFRSVALHGAPPAFAEARARNPWIKTNPKTLLGRVAALKQPVQLADIRDEPAFREDPSRFAFLELAGARTVVNVPMLNNDELVGSIGIYRQEVRPFTDKQVELLSNFAAQAVIAIENTRLLNELRQRTDDLTESLEQQTATTEVLKVISSSPGELELVFNSVLENATRLCGAHFGALQLYEGGAFRNVAMYNVPASYATIMARAIIKPHPEAALGRLVRTKQPAQIEDLRALAAYRDGDPGVRSFSDLAGARTLVVVPMLRESELIGSIGIYRQEVRPFTDKQIDLVKNFAAQAVIAIENARLFEEVQARNRDLTALGKVGRAVSSTLDLKIVLKTIIDHAVELSGTDGGSIFYYREDVGQFELGETSGFDEDVVETYRKLDITAGQTGLAEAIASRQPLQIADITKRASNPLRDAALEAGLRAVLIVPLLGGEHPLGALVLQRRRQGEFSEAVVSLMQSFADQSVIALENARLFEEIAQKGRELELASRHKSQFVANMSHELRTPLAAILGYAELMQEGFYGQQSDKSLDVLKRIRSNGKHLLGLINTVLDIAKIESGQFSLNLADYALESVIETVRAATESLAETKKLALKTDVGKDLPTGLGDEQRLTQVLLNLVGNAIKFTDSGEVLVSAAVTNGQFAVSVADTGPGIPVEEQSRVFEQFHQVDNSNTKAKGGTGLGLAIAKQIVEMHGGRIWVESTPGHGAKFQLELPVRAGSLSTGS